MGMTHLKIPKSCIYLKTLSVNKSNIIQAGSAVVIPF